MPEESAGTKFKKAIVGDKANETIKAGTLVVTRGIGVVAVGLIGTFTVMDWFDGGPWRDMTPEQKLLFVLGAGFIWAIVLAGDAIARGLATAATGDQMLVLPSGLMATKTEGVDDTGWRVAAVKMAPNGTPETASFLLLKGRKQEWVQANELTFK
jgi:hypothetical protein